MSNPTDSVVLIEQDSYTSRRFISPEALVGSESYTIARRKMKIYRDTSGKFTIPPEWHDAGVTVVSRRTGGPERGSYISYEFMPGNST